ncbi:hypothetical protein IACHDJAJ_00020 [Aeromonas phage vB_AdhS_TS3]|nr:hypothetical protein IACHDJAJ_00020 [Aeromonas phage vB_AdhS_TS3]
MFETTGTTPVKGITLDRKEFVTKLNSYHAMKYSLWLGGRDNTPALALEYFGSPKHHASSNAAIERGKAYMTTATLVDNNEIIF